MHVTSPKTSRRFLMPEVVQTSAMDCGPAALKCLLEGFGIRVSYGRLREACQTDVDGTSIDTMEEIARQLGLEAEQIMIPVDHLLIPAAHALPAIVVVRHPGGETHFVVAWHHHGRVVQVMDPATGRRWPRAQRFLREVYLHTQTVSASAWRTWAGAEEFLHPLQQRMAQIGCVPASSDRLISSALADTQWFSLAALDAATRMTNSIVRSGGLKAGRHAEQGLLRFYEKAPQTIPAAYWCVQPAKAMEEEAQLLLRGAVLVRALQPMPSEAASAAANNDDERKTLSPELVAALAETPVRPEREFFRLLLQDGWKNPALIVLGLLAAAVGILCEALLFRSLMEVGELLDLPIQRFGAMAVLLVLTLGLLLLQFPNTFNLWRFGRRVELRLRMAFLQKIPRLGDRYFQSRPISDMAERSHALHQLTELPSIFAQFLRAIFELLLTAAGIAWIDPASAPLAFVAATFAVGLPLMTLPWLAEKDLRLRTHSSALGRFYLDALLGLVAIRNHGAESAIRNEHEGLLAEWARASLDRHRLLALLEGAHSVIGFGFAAWILFNYLGRNPETSWMLLLAYWALYLPMLGQAIAQIAQQYPTHRNTILRLFEPLGAPEEVEWEGNGKISPSAILHESKPNGVALSLRQVSVRVAGHTILHELDFNLAAGSHVAIVGPSGAGKSSLVGIFLGWHRPAAGEIFVEGEALTHERLQQLRRETAWVDPAVQLWNRSLYDNLHYGNDDQRALPLGAIIEQAELMSVLQKLPEGLQTSLGESGGLVSGGEGQRVRLGRAMLRSKVQLAILDEPFRGLDREQRRVLLGRCRALWQEATLLCITHDVGETLGFDRVLVIEHGRIVDDGIPRELAQREDSRYGALLQAENAVREQLWSDERWRKIWVGKN